MTLTEPKWYQYISMHLLGKGKVHCPTYDDTANSDDETYADLSVVVWGNKEAPQPTKIDPGSFTFPFQLAIPPHCPPTFNSIHGSIDYKLFGIISSQKFKYNIETPLIIRALVDLNQQPHLLQPINQSAVKNIATYSLCRCAEVQVILKMPKTGFCLARECIPVTFECWNGSSRQITARVLVTQSIIYNAKGCITHGCEGIREFSCQIQPLGLETKSLEFALPPSVLPGFTTKIITVTYFVRLWILKHSLEATGIHSPLISVPIVIGNVPFNGTGQSSLPPSSTQPSAAGPPSLQQQQPGYPPQGPGPGVPPVAMRQPSVVETPPNAELQSQAPPSYRAVLSGEIF